MGCVNGELIRRAELLTLAVLLDELLVLAVSGKVLILGFGGDRKS